jgi:hypothetical protein
MENKLNIKPISMKNNQPFGSNIKNQTCQNNFDFFEPLVIIAGEKVLKLCHYLIGHNLENNTWSQVYKIINILNKKNRNPKSLYLNYNSYAFDSQHDI